MQHPRSRRHKHDLKIPAADRAVYDRQSGICRSLLKNVSRADIIQSIHHNIRVRQQAGGVFFCEEFGDGAHADIRVDVFDPLRSCQGFINSHIAHFTEELPVQI